MLDARGVVEPWQEPRSSRGWFVLVLGIVVFAAFGGVVGYAYFKGLPGIGGEPPLIRADAEPYRHAPDDRGGLRVPNANSSIVTVLRPEADAPRVERVLPPESAPPLEATEPEATVGQSPEQPNRLETPETPSSDDVASMAPEATSTAPALPYPRSKPQLSELESEAGPTEPQISALPAEQPPPIESAAPPVAEASAPPPQPAPPPVAQAPAPPAQSAAQQVPPPAQTTAAAPPPAPPPATQTPRQLVRAEPAAPTPAPAPAATTTIGAGIYRLQLAAVRSEGGLTQAWADLRQRYPVALNAVNPQVERTDTTSGPLYRLQAGPFTSREAAANACGTIRASGGQCFIVGPLGQ